MCEIVIPFYMTIYYSEMCGRRQPALNIKQMSSGSMEWIRPVIAGVFDSIIPAFKSSTLEKHIR